MEQLRLQVPESRSWKSLVRMSIQPAERQRAWLGIALLWLAPTLPLWMIVPIFGPDALEFECCGPLLFFVIAVALGTIGGSCVDFRMTLSGVAAFGVTFAVGFMLWPANTLGIPPVALVVTARDVSVASLVWLLMFLIALLFHALNVVRVVERYRRGTAEYCAHCRYSLRGLPEPRCPECGTPFTPPKGGLALTQTPPPDNPC